MNALGWIVALIAAAGSLALPFSRGLPFVLALTPFVNAYGAAGATALVLLRWALLELPSTRATRECIHKVALAFIFLGGAIVLSCFVADDLLRLLSESAQWIVGVGLFAAVLIGGNQPHERPLMLGLIAGGGALAIAHILMRILEVHVEEPELPFLNSEGNNYAALFVLVALVVVPAHPAARVSTPIYLLLAALAITEILLQDSRAQLLIAGGVIAGVLLLRHTTPRATIMVAATGTALLAFVMLRFLGESMFSNSSLLSLANFQTNFSNLERLGLMLHSLDFFAANPLGGGLGASSDIFPDSPFTIGSYPTPHNTFALMIVELGWWGLIAYVGGVAALMRIGIRACLEGDPVGFAALSAVALTLIDAVFFNGSVSLVFWLLMALAVNARVAERRTHIPVLFERVA